MEYNKSTLRMARLSHPFTTIWSARTKRDKELPTVLFFCFVSLMTDRISVFEMNS